MNTIARSIVLVSTIAAISFSSNHAGKRLKIRGYVGMALLGRTVYWTKS